MSRLLRWRENDTTYTRRQTRTPELVSYWFAGLVHVCCRFHSVIWTSQWEPSSSLLLTFCLLYIPVSRLANYSACHLLACWIFAELISSTLKMEAICSSETSVETQRTARRHIPEDDIFYNHRCENLKSHKHIHT
jgi:hypothetical protein